MTILIAGLVCTLVANGLTMQLLEQAFHAERLRALHFREPLPTRTTPLRRSALLALNSALSLLVLFAAAVPLHSTFFTDAPAAPLRIALQALGIFLGYDALYYALHRWVLHDRRALRFVHALHHGARTPSARESLYTHPLELLAGLGILLLSTWLVGPVHVWAFVIANFVYSELNLFNHAGIEFPPGPLAIFNYWARSHHGHHGVDMNRNFASLTPLWDRLLGTAV